MTDAAPLPTAPAARSRGERAAGGARPAADPSSPFFRAGGRNRFTARRARVISVEQVAPVMLRVRVTGPDFADFVSGGPADHVRVFFPDPVTGELVAPTAVGPGEDGIVRPDGPVHARDFTPLRVVAPRRRSGDRPRLLPAPLPRTGGRVGRGGTRRRRTRHRRPPRIEGRAAGRRPARPGVRRDGAALGDPLGCRGPAGDVRRPRRDHRRRRRLGGRVPRRDLRSHATSASTCCPRARATRRSSRCSTASGRMPRPSSSRRARHPLSSRFDATFGARSDSQRSRSR